MQIKSIAAAVATAAIMSVSSAASAQEITEFRIGILGGENANDRLKSHECLKDRTEALLGVETKIFAPADYSGVIEGLIGGTWIWPGLEPLLMRQFTWQTRKRLSRFW